MKGVLKALLINAAIFALVLRFIPAVSVSNDPKIFAIVVFVIFLANFFVRPILKMIFFLPFNLLTLNLSSFVLFLLIFNFLPVFVSGFSISRYNFGGLSTSLIIIPAFEFTPFQTTALVALIIAMLSYLLDWIFN